MAKALLSWINHVDLSATVLSSSGHAGDLAPSNLADPIVGKRFRTTSLTGWGQADFGANKTVGVLALVFPRDTTFPTSGTVRWQLDVDGGTAGAGATYDSTAISIGASEGYGYHLHLPTEASVRYVRFTFAVTGLSFIDVGRLWAGEAWRPDVNIVGGYEDEWDDLSVISRAQRSGAEYVDERPNQRLYAVGLEALDDSDRNDIREMQRIVGISKQLLFCLDPDSFTRQTILGRLRASTPIRHRALTSHLYTKAFAIRESL
jgi:hypothetical protein